MKVLLGLFVVLAVAGYIVFLRLSRRFDRIRRAEDARKAEFQRRLIEGGMNAELDYIVERLDRDLARGTGKGSAVDRRGTDRMLELRTVLLRNRDLAPASFDAVGAVAKEVASWQRHDLRGTIEHVAFEGTLELRGSEELFRWAIGELISNTVSHAGRWTRIAVRLAPGPGDCAVLTVSDDGEGPDVMAVSRLYGGFTPRIDSEGPGLGLFAVRSIVERMGGSISASPGEHGGLTHTARILPRPEERLRLPSIARVAEASTNAERPRPTL